MKVVTLLENDFEAECKRLAHLVAKDYRPDLVVGIRTGGGYVGKRVHTALNGDGKVRYLEVSIERGGTEIKRKINLRQILQVLPEPILNFLRVLEVMVLELISKFRVPKRQSNFIIPDDIRSFLNEGQRKILLVDDCVDTGATLKCVLDFFSSGFGEGNQQRCAVITKAHRKPLVDVEYLLYNRVLIRFPWSFDTKGGMGKNYTKAGQL